ncbi:MAG: hypothetical protein NTZ09_15485 [Candidatus Hydrogenedentes bacterium]|nr:hypothetical protein [Candidatus Hydrogenedentota bacterium]
MKTSTALVVALVVCALAGIGALACNTVKGSGRVIEKGGTHVHNAAGQNANEHPRPHTITASAELGGSISPAGGTSVSRGSSQTFIATANTGYRIADLLVDGRSVGALSDLYHDNSSSYTFNNVAANHVISASFDLNQSL